MIFFGTIWMANVVLPISSIDYLFVRLKYVNGANVAIPKFREINAIDRSSSYIAIFTAAATKHHFLFLLGLGGHCSVGDQ
jgi:hypothetical protein